MDPDLHDSGKDSRISNQRSYWRTLLDDLSGAPRFPAPRLWASRLLPVIVGVLVTIVLVAGNYDLRLQQAIYRAGENSWALGEHPVWQFLYHVGPYPAVILGVGALVGLSLSWAKPRFARWRRVYLFVGLLMFLGPAIIVNFALKDHWGRPRPIHVDSIGGKQSFENVFVLNESRQGKSFPCGHASTGFVLMAGFFVFCRHRRRLAYGCLIFGAVFGLLLGLTRMLQGGHFLTDVIWGGLICHYLALLLYSILGLEDRVFREATQGRKMPVKVRILLLLVAAVSLFGILLATPYRDKRSMALADVWKNDTPFQFRVTLELGRVKMIPSDKLGIVKKSSGHGVPTSRLASMLYELGDEKSLFVHYFERKSGWFHELETETNFEVPWNRIVLFDIDNRLADVFVQPGGLDHKIAVNVGAGGGVITIDTGETPIVWADGDKSKLGGSEFLENDPKIDKGLFLNVSDEFNGMIRLVE